MPEKRNAMAMASLSLARPQDLESSLPDEETVLSDEECLKERKWWVFLLSSVLTFIMGVMSVVVARAFVALCCRKDEDDYTQVRKCCRYQILRRVPLRIYMPLWSIIRWRE